MTFSELLTGDRQNKAWNLVLGFIAILLLITFLGVFQIVRTGATADQQASVQRSTDLRTCTSKARGPLEDARTAVEVLILDGLRTSAEGDRARYQELLDAVPAALDALTQATEGYKASVQRSADDPDGFLADCNLTGGDS